MAQNLTIDSADRISCVNSDLIIVCFGLNDVNDPLEVYLSSLKTIFEKCKASGSEVVFMTPKMLNTYVADDAPERYRDYAGVTAEYQNSGRMDNYMESAVNLANEMGVKVCDCYKKWKKLSETEDITKLLINRINHPTPEMHELFANSLFELIFEEEIKSDAEESTMYRA